MTPFFSLWFKLLYVSQVYPCGPSYFNYRSHLVLDFNLEIALCPKLLDPEKILMKPE